MKLLKYLCSLIVLWAALSCAAQEPQSFVLPGEYESEEHPSFSHEPFNRGPSRMQIMYHADNFAEGMPEGAIFTGIAFRLDGPRGVGFTNSANTVVPDVEIRASTTPSLDPVISLEFARNIGADETVIHSRGSLPLTSTWDAAGPNPFSLSISFEEEFVYHPSQGHLLLDFLIYERAAQGLILDGGGAIGGRSIGEIDLPLAEEYAVTAPAIQLFYIPIPEPASWVLFGCGALALVAFRPKRL